MNAVCTQCNASYRVPENRMPARKVSFACKRCGEKVILDSGTMKRAAPPKRPATRSPEPAVMEADACQTGGIVSQLPGAKAFATERYSLGRLFPPDRKGRYQTRRNQQTLRCLSAVGAALDKALAPGEKVVHLAGGSAHYPAELFFGYGCLTVLYNRYVLVATTKRLIAINTDYRMRHPAHYLFQFSYGEIKKVSSGLFGGRLVLTFRRGRRRIFSGLRAAVSREMKEYMASRVDAEAGSGTAAPVRQCLCPGCFTPLGEKLATCPACRAMFKSPHRAAWRSLLLPGLGDVYLGHRISGACEIFGSLLVWLIFLSAALSGASDSLAVSVLFLMAYNGMDGLLTLHVAKRGYSLDSRKAREKFRAGLVQARPWYALRH